MRQLLQLRFAGLVLCLLRLRLRSWVGFVGIFALLDGFDDTDSVPFCISELGLDFLVCLAPYVQEFEECRGGEESICGLPWEFIRMSSRNMAENVLTL
jgi:hypothetical protein